MELIVFSFCFYLSVIRSLFLINCERIDKRTDMAASTGMCKCQQRDVRKGYNADTCKKCSKTIHRTFFSVVMMFGLYIGFLSLQSQRGHETASGVLVILCIYYTVKTFYLFFAKMGSGCLGFQFYDKQCQYCKKKPSRRMLKALFSAIM